MSIGEEEVGELPPPPTPGPQLVHITRLCGLEAKARFTTYQLCQGRCPFPPRPPPSDRRLLKALETGLAAARMAASFWAQPVTPLETCSLRAPLNLTPNLLVQATLFLQPQDFLQLSCLKNEGFVRFPAYFPPSTEPTFSAAAIVVVV